jgi:hypothetical protein
MAPQMETDALLPPGVAAASAQPVEAVAAVGVTAETDASRPNTYKRIASAAALGSALLLCAAIRSGSFPGATGSSSNAASASNGAGKATQTELDSSSLYRIPELQPFSTMDPADVFTPHIGKCALCTARCTVISCSQPCNCIAFAFVVRALQLMCTCLCKQFSLVLQCIIMLLPRHW